MNSKKPGKPFAIVGGAIVILFLLSLLPWGDITGNKIKNFNLLSDLFKSSQHTVAEETIDPELVAALAENTAPAEGVDSAKSGQLSDPVSTGAVSYNELTNPKEPVDNVAADGTVIFEDYTEHGQGLVNLKRALASPPSRPVRIGVIGDSYIEGDILTMDIREELQSRYGGQGVGYMPASSELTGFRTSVKQKCKGWTKHEIRKKMADDMKTLPGEYFTSGGNGNTSFAGVKKPAHLDSWNRTMVLAVAPNGGSVTIETDGSKQTFELPADESVKALTINGTTSNATVSATLGIDVVGVYLDGSVGIAVDNMSLRGNSGQTHRKLSVERAAQMREFVDYDLIVVEYGINALSSAQTDYSGYEKLMIQTVLRLRECYPNADILVMGIGDRGQKQGSEVRSVPTSENMVSAQRDIARKTGTLFWDTRKAMGGENAVVTWRQNGFINPDYIHLNAKGGKELAQRFLKALDYQL